MTHDIERFVTDKKLVMERFMHGSPTHAVALFEYDISPDAYSSVARGRAQNITWELLWEYTFTFTKGHSQNRQHL